MPAAGSTKCNILVLGAGTCKEAVSLAVFFANAHVTALDLSARSLAVGTMKAAELGINKRLTVHQGDILQLLTRPNSTTFTTKFEVISSGGVLHHDNLFGTALMPLCKLLLPGGLLRMAVYSRLARQDVTDVKQHFSSAASESPQALRLVRHQCKQKALSGEKGDKSFRKVIKRPSFHTAAELHDLLFTPHDSCHDLPEVAAALNACGLKIINVELDSRWEEAYQEFSSGCDHWTRDTEMLWAFEQQHPNCMGSMYIVTAQLPL